jgi:hypothetical protein
MAIFIFIILTVLFSLIALVYFANSIRSLFEGYFMNSLVSFAITVGLIIIAFHFGSLIMKHYQNPNVQKEILLNNIKEAQEQYDKFMSEHPELKS